MFDDAKREFGAYAFRFANPSVPEGQAVKASIPMFTAQDSLSGPPLFSAITIASLIILVGGGFLSKVADGLLTKSKFAQPLPVGFETGVKGGDW